jgi:tetratricopeptide (TPR) repeat protein
LIKLKIYTEALVALTRAQRIFERVLSPTQKYRKWTEQAIESVFRQMGGYYTVSPLATTTANEPTDGAKGQVANDVDDEHTAEETECTDDNDDSEADGGDSCGGEDGSTGEHDLEKISHDMFKLGVGQSIDRERTGDACRREGSIDEAISEYRLAISLMNSLMHAHPDSADLYCKIAMLLRQQGCFDLALEEQKDALAIYELSLGMEHPEALKTLSQTIEKKRTNQMQLAILEKLEASKKS